MKICSISGDFRRQWEEDPSADNRDRLKLFNDLLPKGKVDIDKETETGTESGFGGSKREGTTLESLEGVSGNQLVKYCRSDEGKVETGEQVCRERQKTEAWRERGYCRTGGSGRKNMIICILSTVETNSLKVVRVGYCFVFVHAPYYTKKCSNAPAKGKKKTARQRT